jgi:hypothetical protein
MSVMETLFVNIKFVVVALSVFSFLQLWTGGGPRGRPGRHADRTANTIAVEVARVPRPVTAGNTVQAGTSFPPIVPEECALVSCCELHISCQILTVIFVHRCYRLRYRLT